MKNQDDHPKDPATLRQRAEMLARERINETPEGGAPLSPEEVWITLHELQVHQIELEMQNEELRRAQAEVEAARARYFDLYDMAPVGYLTLSEQGLILEGNLTAATLLGVSRSMLKNLPISRLILKEDQDIYYLHRKRLLELGEPQECELRLVNGNGECLWALLRGTVARSEDGALVCRTAVSDISLRKRIEADNEKLQDQLIQSRQMESVGRLAGGVAHYFNNMLEVIMGNLELAMERVRPGDPVRTDLEEVQIAAQRSATLTAQLLAYARKQIIVPKILDLNETVEGMLTILRRLVGEEIALVWNPGADLWRIRMDPSQVDQVLTNLCVNARDAIMGSGRITTSTSNVALSGDDARQEPDVTPGDYVALTVEDDGRGMDAKTLSLLFEPFFTTKPTGKGTGLGLASVYGMVKQNRGLITAASELGRGTRITVLLPRHEATAPGLSRW